MAPVCQWPMGDYVYSHFITYKHLRNVYNLHSLTAYLCALLEQWVQYILVMTWSQAHCGL